MFKRIIRFLFKTFNLPKMSCYGCLKDDCINRTKGENKVCDGYVRSIKL